MGNRYPLTFPQAPLPLGKIEEPRPPEMGVRFLHFRRLTWPRPRKRAAASGATPAAGPAADRWQSNPKIRGLSGEMRQASSPPEIQESPRALAPNLANNSCLRCKRISRSTERQQSSLFARSDRRTT